MAKQKTKSETEMTWKDMPVGGIVSAPGSAGAYKTGDWRSQRPILDKSKCNKCGLCFIYCPEGCIQPDKEGYFIANLDYCKGCGVCLKECPRKAIVMAEEAQ